MITPIEDSIIEKLVALAKLDARIDVLWLYGSQAKGTANEHSDYDLAVAFNSFPEDAWYKRLQPELLAFDFPVLHLSLFGLREFVPFTFVAELLSYWFSFIFTFIL